MAVLGALVAQAQGPARAGRMVNDTGYPPLWKNLGSNWVAFSGDGP